ncbi:AI-2E family transporter [Phormidesmis priestleyi ULC007]|uniref:AI-2E family transporter n=1 Tax=Phormidesmis priestleyi ULC007 TaxID=1920490 RepID=A0A2T1DM34_9CYAN|nr:AI-2E family transporter [Phormidesmis priestleyi]PSB21567.1 AI-2E family transporter [Phormidesmis priestleyi ULC007]PZO54607.1 MAG: AI-2E family transporter [Phormidesmis priestleyi]
MHKSNKVLNWWNLMTPVARAVTIALVAPLLVLNAWAISSIFDYFHSLLVILIAASLLTFLLNYPVSFMQAHGATRGRAAIVVFLFTLSIFLGLGVTLVPLAIEQAQQLVLRLPEWFDSGQRQLFLLNDQIESAGFPINLDILAEQITDRLKSSLQGITGEVLNLAVFTVTSLLDLLLTLVLTFYLLQHSDRLWQSLIEWLPTSIRQPFSQTLRLSFQNFFFGQLISATLMGSTLTIIFLVMRVPFGLLFGLTIGTMALVPFGGSVGIAIVTLLVALRDIGVGVEVLIAALIVQQIVENLIAPRVIGSVTGLNPVWVFLAILTGARVGGLLGVVIAVPTAVVVKSALVALRSPTPVIVTPADHAAISQPNTIAEKPEQKAKEIASSQPVES